MYFTPLFYINLFSAGWARLARNMNITTSSGNDKPVVKEFVADLTCSDIYTIICKPMKVISGLQASSGVVARSKGSYFPLVCFSNKRNRTKSIYFFRSADFQQSTTLSQLLAFTKSNTEHLKNIDQQPAIGK